ncbi:helix-turn-helix domain-containing protein [Pseudoalteromonas rhizosphaerae]|uniref:helix-turn-helix domain-containing protein n=1 Tax=Pseudoalteromonas rhizosphaerae TaxID=2518973 RepID=UPI0012304E29|nr:helix-turn-helix transcriptional regulator [Pseudoalteromonas rhizosphaerae]
MSELNKTYNAGTSPTTLDGFKNRAFAKSNESGEYEPPTPQDIKALRQLMGWSQTDVARIVGVSWNHKGSTAVRKWETAPDKKEHNKISYSAWRGLLCRAGIVEYF